MGIKRTNQKTDRVKFERGFTLLEVMIAVSIFGFLMIYVSQFMRLEIRLFDKATQEDTLEQSARFAMLHTVDQIRRTQMPKFELGTDDKDRGIYNGSDCIINLNPSDSNLLVLLDENSYYNDENDDDKETIFYNMEKLMLKKGTKHYLIADHIRSIEFELEGPRLLKISILASDEPDDSELLGVNGFQLITWLRF